MVGPRLRGRPGEEAPASGRAGPGAVRVVGTGGLLDAECACERRCRPRTVVRRVVGVDRKGRCGDAGSLTCGTYVCGTYVCGTVVGPVTEALGSADRAAVAAQLGRPPRGARAVAHRCACGLPDVVETAPRLDDGAPFPTLYYLSCPRAASAVGRLEASGLMREMTQRLADDPRLAAAYEAAHRDYIARRDALEVLPGEPGVGGMPGRVKCLHALVAHSLAVGRGVNPLGDEALDLLPHWGAKGRCVEVVAESGGADDA